MSKAKAKPKMKTYKMWGVFYGEDLICTCPTKKSAQIDATKHETVEPVTVTRTKEEVRRGS